MLKAGVEMVFVLWEGLRMQMEERGGRYFFIFTYIFYIRFGNKPLLCNIKVRGEEAAHGFREGYALRMCEAALFEISNDGVGIEMMDVWGCLEMRRFVLVIVCRQGDSRLGEPVHRVDWGFT